MENTKIFSIIVPAYNAEKTIIRTLASFISNIDYIKEVIVVNDHCTDNTMKIVKSWKALLPIKICINNGYHNTGRARKTGLLEATGDWVAFIDSDDCLTNSALVYVYKQLQEHPEAYILNTLTMFYEFGDFIPENITYNEGSCGGVYYNRDFLISHNLFPHDNLKLSEDEYFNNKILKYIHKVLKNPDCICEYKYPTYEVHHDNGHVSLALRNWLDYSIYWHLECQRYLTEDYLTFTLTDTEWIKEDFMRAFIFCYYILLCGYGDERHNKKELESYFKYFKKALDFYVNTFNTTSQELVSYFNSNWAVTMSLRDGAMQSAGTEPARPFLFSEFIEKIRGEIA